MPPNAPPPPPPPGCPPPGPPPPGPPPPGPPPPGPPPGCPPPNFPPGDKQGLCGLTSDQWQLVLKLCIPLLIFVLIVLVISRINSFEITIMWCRVQERYRTVRMGLRERLFGHLLSEDDISSGRIVTGPTISPRSYPILRFLSQRLPMQREP